MSQKHVQSDTRVSVISYMEIGLIFLTFLTVLFFLYPKNHLEKQILKESSNYDLTVIYLHNLMKLEPKNSKLLLTLAKTLKEQKKYKLATGLLELLKDDSSLSIRQKSALLQIEINDLKLEKESNYIKRDNLKVQNYQLLKRALSAPITNKELGEKLYNIALSCNSKELALKVCDEILPFTEKKERIKWLKNTHYLAQEINNRELDKKALIELIERDKKNVHSWILNYSSKFAQTSDTEEIIKTLKLKDETKAYFYESNKQIDKAAAIYLDLYKKIENKKRKKELFLKIIKMYRSNNQVVKAATFAHQREDDFINDNDLVKKLLKIYIEANKAEYAKELSLKLINLEDTQ